MGSDRQAVDGELSGICKVIWRKWTSYERPYERRRLRAKERSRRNNDEMRRRGKTR